MDNTDKNIIAKLESLPENFWDFSNANTRTHTHGLHAYPAMMISPISRNIIGIIGAERKINSLLDPFSGSGTVLVEGQLAGIPHVVGNDINPFAVFLSKVKTTPLDSTEMYAEIARMKSALESVYCGMAHIINGIDKEIELLGYDLTDKDGWGANAPRILELYFNRRNISIKIPSFKNIGYWFKPKVIMELSLIRDVINSVKSSEIKNFLFLAFSETIRLVSNRRNGEFKMFRMPPDKVKEHNPDTRVEFLKILDRNSKKITDFSTGINAQPRKSTVELYNDDACSLQNIDDGVFDLIITSPPYGDSRTTVAYGEFSRLSLQWLDIFKSDGRDVMRIDKLLMGGKKFKNGFDFDIPSDNLRMSLDRIRRLDMERAGDVFSFYRDFEKSVHAISKKTKIGGYHFWVVGNRTVKNENLQTDIILEQIAEKYGMQKIYSIRRNISNKVMPSKNSPTNVIGEKNTTICNEHIVILKKIA